MPSPRTLLSSGPVVLGGVLRGRAQAWPLPPSPCPQPPHHHDPRADFRHSSVLAEALGHAETPPI